MSFESEKARLRFLKYAFTSLDKKHSIPEDYRNKILTDIKNGKAAPKLEDDFMAGIVGCSAMSVSGKIDEEAVDRYFLGPHNTHSDCKAYGGKVVSLSENEVLVQTQEGERNYKNILNLRKGDTVIVHGNYVIDVIK